MKIKSAKDRRTDNLFIMSVFKGMLKFGMNCSSVPRFLFILFVGLFLGEFIAIYVQSVVLVILFGFFPFMVSIYFLICSLCLFIYRFQYIEYWCKYSK